MVTVTELNRAPDGRFESLEATGSFTDPSGIEYTGAINPVQVTEEASTFAESDITLTQTNTTVSNGSVELSGTQTSGDVVVGWDSGVPNDLDSYDLATFQRSLDSETVTVDVGESVDSLAVFEDFEDADISIADNNWSGWNGDTGSFSAQQGTVISGSYSGELTTANTLNTVDADRGQEITNTFQCDIEIDSQSSDDGDSVRLQFRDGASNLFGSVQFTDNGPIEWRGDTTNIQSSWSVNTTYTVKVNFDFSSNTADVTINGTTTNSLDFDTSASGWQNFQLLDSTTSSGITRNAYIDDVGVVSPSFSVIFSDISQNFDISTVDTSKNVKLRANLSRNDTSNNPTVDYLARRFNRS